MTNRIDHTGIVERIDGSHICVKILQTSACASCQAKAMCASAEAKEKIIDVYDDDAHRYQVGDAVSVCGSLSMGRNAVTLAFTIPLLLVVACVTLMLHLFHTNELTAIGVSMAVLATYYLALAASKKRLKRTFSFWIEKV